MSEVSDVEASEQAADIAVPAERPREETAEPPRPEPRVRRLNIIGRRNIFFAISLLIIIPLGHGASVYRLPVHR